MPFEVFKRQMAPLAKRPFVTIQKKGILSLNASAHAQLGDPDAVELLFDREERKIGIRAIDANAEHAYAIRSMGKAGSSWLISAIAFADYYQVPTEIARRYPVDVQDNILIVDLNGPSTEIVSNRNKSRNTRSPASPPSQGGG